MKDRIEHEGSRALNFIEGNWEKWVFWLALGIILWIIAWAILKFHPRPIEPTTHRSLRTAQWLSLFMVALNIVLLLTALVMHFREKSNDDDETTTTCSGIRNTAILRATIDEVHAPTTFYVAWKDNDGFKHHAVLSPGQYEVNLPSDATVNIYEKDCSVEEVSGQLDLDLASEDEVSTAFKRTGDYEE